MKKVPYCPVCRRELEIRTLYCPKCDVEVRGRFHQSPFNRLSPELERFLYCFVETQGNLKDLEQIFQVSYPTIKKMIRKLQHALGMTQQSAAAPPASAREHEILSILDDVDKDRIKPMHAIKRLKTKGEYET